MGIGSIGTVRTLAFKGVAGIVGCNGIAVCGLMMWRIVGREHQSLEEHTRSGTRHWHTMLDHSKGTGLLEQCENMPNGN